MDFEITWSAPEFHYYQKGPLWYWGLVGAASILGVLALWQQNYFFALFIVLAAILSGIWGARTPRTIHYKLTGEGLDIRERKFYPYDAFSGFSVVSSIPESEALGEIVLSGRGVTGSRIRIIVGKDILPEVREAFLKKIPELEHEDSISEHIGRILRF